MAWATAASSDRLVSRGWARLIAAGLLIACLGCLPDYSPWSTEVPEGMQDSNARNLALLQARPVVGDEFEVVLISDPQRNVFALREIVAILSARPDLDRVAFVIVLGDVTDYGLLEEFLDAYEVLAALPVPFLAVPGNHDSISHGKEIYRKLFGPFDLAFDYHGTRFLLVNNNYYEFSDVPNLAWLAEQAQASPLPEQIVVASHVPLTETERPEPAQAARDLLVRLGIRAHVAGHLHEPVDVAYPGGLVLFAVDNVAVGTLPWARMLLGPQGIRFERCQAANCQPAGRLVPKVRPRPSPGPLG